MLQMCFSLASCHCVQRWNIYLQVKKIHAYIFKYYVYVLLCPIFQMLLKVSNIKLIFILLLWVPSYPAKPGLTAIQTHLISCTQGEICVLDTCWEFSPSVRSSGFKSETNGDVCKTLNLLLLLLLLFLKLFHSSIFFFTSDILPLVEAHWFVLSYFLKSINKQINKKKTHSRSGDLLGRDRIYPREPNCRTFTFSIMNLQILGNCNYSTFPQQELLLLLIPFIVHVM